jgi:hypothetical protein
MRKLSAICSTICIFFATVAPQPLSAAIVQVQYRGTVVSGMDVSGIFLLPGTSLAGVPYSVLYRFDTNRGVRTTILPSLDSIIGGPFNGTTNPSLGAELTIAGTTFSFNGRNLGLQSNFPLGGAISSFVSDLAGLGQFNASFIGNSLQTVGIPVPIETAFESRGETAISGFTNSFQIATGGGSIVERFASGTFETSHVRVSLLSAVPEPSSWMMLIAGFFILGSVVRSRRGTQEILGTQY